MEKNVWGKGYFLLSKIQHFLNWSLHPLPLLIKLVTPDFLKGFHTNFFFAPVGCQSNSKLQVFFFFSSFLCCCRGSCNPELCWHGRLAVTWLLCCLIVSQSSTVLFSLCQFLSVRLTKKMLSPCWLVFFLVIFVERKCFLVLSLGPRLDAAKLINSDCSMVQLVEEAYIFCEILVYQHLQWICCMLT